MVQAEPARVTVTVTSLAANWFTSGSRFVKSTSKDSERGINLFDEMSTKCGTGYGNL